MIFEQIATGGCQSYLIGCSDTGVAALIDPQASRLDHYLARASSSGLRVRFVVDTHTHADHFSGARQLALRLGVPTVMHRASPAGAVDMRVDDGDLIMVGNLRLEAIHTPGHTADSMCLKLEDRVFTGDTLLIGGTGRTDLPSGDPEALYESLFGRLLRLDPALEVYPAHDYKQRGHSTIGRELAENPRLQKRCREDFVAMMRGLDLALPTHLTEALRTNISGGKTVTQLIEEASANLPFMSLGELYGRIRSGDPELIVLDVREREAFEEGHIAGARNLPRGQIELRVDQELPDPTCRIVACCEVGRISTLAASTLRVLGFQRAVALDGGVLAWQAAGYPVESGEDH